MRQGEAGDREGETGDREGERKRERETEGSGGRDGRGEGGGVERELEMEGARMQARMRGGIARWGESEGKREMGSEGARSRGRWKEREGERESAIRPPSSERKEKSSVVECRLPREGWGEDDEDLLQQPQEGDDARGVGRNPSHFPALSFPLRIAMGRIKNMGEGFFAGGGAWKLETLVLSELDELDEDWAMIERALPFLRLAHVQDCPKLKYSEEAFQPGRHGWRTWNKYIKALADTQLISCTV
ncbi:hypothetical protein ACLOJK_039283 [Asimina triloba]